VNGSVFHYDYTDIQINAINLQTGLTNLYNAAAAKITGADVEFNAPVTRAFSLSGGAAYTKAEYRDFNNAILFTRRPTGGNIQSIGNASGNDMVRTPKWTANLGAHYVVPVADGDLTFNAAAYYNSGFFWHVDNRIKQKAYTLVNASVSWAPEDGNYRVTLWGRNLTDKLYQYYAAEAALGDGVAYARPRSYGVTVAMKFQ
jgi:iron complex outermembrane receptor protein